MAPADGRSGPAVLAACAARRWLARSAAGVRLIGNQSDAAAPACTSLVACLPALEDAEMNLCAPVVPDDLGCLLEALAWCPCLKALSLNMYASTAGEDDNDLYWLFPAPALAKLGRLTSLDLDFHDEDHYLLADVVGALVALTGLENLCLGFAESAEVELVPAALGQLKALRELRFLGLYSCVLEAGCLDLPELQGLEFLCCGFPDGAVLPGISALICLTRLEFSGGVGPHTVVPQVAQLPGLRRLVLSCCLCHEQDPSGPLRLPADVGPLRAMLLHLNVSGNKLTPFPLAVTQLVKLEHLNARDNEFAELPAGITALSRLTELILGRHICREDPLQLHGKRPLDARALGDLSRFPALHELTLNWCEVTLCRSVLGAARHACLASLCFCVAHPAPECAQAVLQLSRELWRLGRGSVLKAMMERPCVGDEPFDNISNALQDAQGRAPCQKFRATLEAWGLEACGL